MAELDLLGLLQGRVQFLHGELDETGQTVAGVTLGIVVDTKDDAGLGRVQVMFPWLSEDVPSAWAPIAQPWAGSRRGTYLLPEQGDQAMVAFQHGDVRFPIILGFVWSQDALPPIESPELDRRALVSRTGHTLVFDDSEASPGLTLRTHGGHEVSLDDKGQRVSVTAAGGKVALVIDAKAGSVTVRADQHDIDLNAPNGFVSITAANIQVQASGELKLGGTKRVRINC
jgi:uncharacterized protein involved in type VI secretion and phage assembly